VSPSFYLLKMLPSIFTLIAGLIALTEALPVSTQPRFAPNHLMKRDDPQPQTNGTAAANGTAVNGTVANATAIVNGTAASGTAVADAAAVKDTCTSNRGSSVDSGNPLKTIGASMVSCIEKGAYSLILNQDGSLMINNKETSAVSWQSKPSKNGAKDLPFWCGIKNGAFVCYGGKPKTIYWSSKTGQEDGYSLSGDDLSVSITDDGKLDASFFYISEID
jgi:hypothetical protein